MLELGKDAIAGGQQHDDCMQECDYAEARGVGSRRSSHLLPTVVPTEIDQ